MWLTLFRADSPESACKGDDSSWWARRNLGVVCTWHRYNAI